METFFTADLHFSHQNVIKYCDRPFSGYEEMDKVLIDSWNDVVPKVKSEVYILGDLGFNVKNIFKKFLPALNGRKHLVLGNHDKGRNTYLNCMEKYGRLLYTVDNYLEIKMESIPVILFHYPIENWNKKHYDSIMLHGHSHGTLPNIVRNRIDVGVDSAAKMVGSYRPISWDKVKSSLRR